MCEKFKLYSISTSPILKYLFGNSTTTLEYMKIKNKEENFKKEFNIKPILVAIK